MKKIKKSIRINSTSVKRIKKQIKIKIRIEDPKKIEENRNKIKRAMNVRDHHKTIGVKTTKRLNSLQIIKNQKKTYKII